MIVEDIRAMVVPSTRSALVTMIAPASDVSRTCVLRAVKTTFRIKTRLMLIVVELSVRNVPLVSDAK